MALSKEDHGDVKKAMGKALANKVAKVTRDDMFKKVTQKRKASSESYKEAARIGAMHQKQWDSKKLG